MWGRIPIALACAALLAGALHDAYPEKTCARWALPALTLFGVASVFWWVGSGDLRPYLLLQLAPLVLIPLLHWQSGALTARRKAFAIAIVLYVLAKVTELNDAALLGAFEGISGHTIKHLLATLAAFVLAREYLRRDVLRQN